ncbi:MAG: tetratricopeptide repeat protein [Treponema sp.]|nr:tetratricopeptide repeat protein [Treponema sp.]
MKKIIYLLLIGFLFFSCNANLTKTAKRMQVMETGVSSPTTIEELEDAIKKYELRIIDIISSESQVGIWYKILGTHYMDEGMYGKALEAFQKAVAIYPANQNLFYYVGLCAGFMSKASLDFDATGDDAKSIQYLNLAEKSYLRAIELENTYVRALYGLSILYVFEFNESFKAIPYLQKLLTIDTKHTDAMFVLARAYYENGNFDGAVDLYDKIERLSTSEEKKAEARANKKVVLDAQFTTN